jgi:hypothetical protein
MNTTLILALIPLMVLQIGLQIFALYDIYKRGGTREPLPPIVWVIIVLVFNLLGPIFYFALGRKEDEYVDERY